MRPYFVIFVIMLALISGRTNAIETEPFWRVICSSYGSQPFIRASFVPVAATDVAPCGPAAFQFRPLLSAGGAGDATVALDVGFDESTSRLCYVSKTFAEAPAIHVGAGHALTFSLTNTLHDSGAHHELNCPIESFGGEGLCYPHVYYPEQPGPNAPYYPIEAQQHHAADGTTNLHTHGLFVSPLPCSDEVLRSTIYPANWILPVVPLLPCQAAINALTYTYLLPPDHPAGAYWYHTHRHGQAEQQSQMGLVGAIIVEDGGDKHRAAIGVTDEVLVVSDTPIKTCTSGVTCDVVARRPATGAARALARQAARVAARIRPAGAVAAGAGPVLDPRIDEIDQAGGCATGAVDASGGDQLWTILLNGAPVLDAPGGQWPPDSQLLRKTMQPGQRQIFRLINASADTFIAPQLVLKINGVETPQPLEVFARDGVGLADAQGNRHISRFDVAANPLIIPPSGRVEFVVHAPAAGQTLYLDSNQVNPGCGGNQYPPRRMLMISSQGSAVSAGAADDSDLLVGAAKLPSYIPPAQGPVSTYRTFVLSEYSRVFTYGLTNWLGGPPPAGAFDPNQVDFYLTEVAASGGLVNPAKTALIPFDPHVQAPQVTVNLHGKDSVTEEWLVENATLEIHAFHMHQVHFRDVTVASADPDQQPVLDVVSVPAAQLVGDVADGYPGAPGWVKLRLTFTKLDVGEFVFHCHILEHEDNGMMAKIKVVAD